MWVCGELLREIGGELFEPRTVWVQPIPKEIASSPEGVKMADEAMTSGVAE